MDDENRGPGRPEANIPWKEVENLLVAGCSGAEVAAFLGLNKATIYERCQTDHGIMFSEYSQQFYAKGDSILKAHQFAKALGKTKEGNDTLLIWLGKVRLKQKEEVSVSIDESKKTDAVIEYLDKIQRSFAESEGDGSSSSNP